MLPPFSISYRLATSPGIAKMNRLQRMRRDNLAIKRIVRDGWTRKKAAKKAGLTYQGLWLRIQPELRRLSEYQSYQGD